MPRKIVDDLHNENENEAIYKGQKYKIKIDKKIHLRLRELIILNNGLYKFIGMDPALKVVNANCENEIKKLEREFYQYQHQHIGKIMTMKFENTGNIDHTFTIK